MNGLSWSWIVLMLTAPLGAGCLVALPFWRSGQAIFGNIVGTLVIFGTALALIGREYVELDRITQACLDAGTTCWPAPTAFTRFAIYAFIGLGEVFVMFVLSVRVEERIRNSRYAPEWR